MSILLKVNSKLLKVIGQLLKLIGQNQVNIVQLIGNITYAYELIPMLFTFLEPEVFIRNIKQNSMEKIKQTILYCYIVRLPLFNRST